MCGIAGFSGNFHADLLDRMNAAQVHRGPDGKGAYLSKDKQVGLAHTRLSIIELSSAGHQPMISDDGKVIITFNGEIYNYRELRKDLERQGVVFKSGSDTEVLLKLYQQDRTCFLKRLNGVFAFAIWDASSSTLLIARDGIGVKPLYYAETSRGFLFASEIKAILQESTVSRELNLDAIRYYFTYLYSPSEATMLKQVYKVAPGEAIWIKESRLIKRETFYQLPMCESERVMNVRDAAKELATLIRQAVQRQMVADVEVGAFLSGGLDSSAVVAFARKLGSARQFQCFTIGFKDQHQKEMIEDLPYANRVAKHLDVKLNTIYVGHEMIDHLDEMIHHLDEPQADPAALNVLFISELAKQQGIKVLLSGSGGDDVFSGYRRHLALYSEKYWSWLPKSIRVGLANHSQKFSNSKIQKAFRFADYENEQRLISYFYWIDPVLAKTLYGQALLDSERKSSVDAPMLQTLCRRPKFRDALERMLHLEARHFLVDHNLNYTDKMSMARGVEVRVPLLDPDVVQWAASIPSSYKQHGSVGKWIFKKAMEPYLPRDVIYRPKTGFGAPLRYWIRNSLRPLVDDVLSTQNLNKRGLFDPVTVKKLIEDDRADRIDASYPIFSLVCIERWCQIFVDC